MTANTIDTWETLGICDSHLVASAEELRYQIDTMYPKMIDQRKGYRGRQSKDQDIATINGLIRSARVLVHAMTELDRDRNPNSDSDSDWDSVSITSTRPEVQA